MSDERFKIYVDRLRTGELEVVKESLSPEFLDVKEKDLSYEDPVELQGEAYLADEMLILRFAIRTFATIPCRICNKKVKSPISVPQLYHALPIDEIKGSVFNFKEILREAVILETPAMAECAGDCPERAVIGRYLKNKKNRNVSDDTDDGGYRPFANIDISPEN